MKNLAGLRQFMASVYNLSDIKDVCFDLEIDFDELEGGTKSNKIISLIQYVHGENRLLELVTFLSEEFEDFEDVNWPESLEVFEALQKFDVAAAEFEGEKSFAVPFLAPPLDAFYVQRDIYQEVYASVLKSESKILSLQGLVGCGKTVLATKLAHDLRENFPDGVLWIRGDEEFVEEDLRRSAEVFGLDTEFNKLESLTQKIGFLKEKLSRKRMLVVLDGLQNDDFIQDLHTGSQAYYMVVTTRDQQLLRSYPNETVPISPFSEDDSISYLKKTISSDRVNDEWEAAQQLHAFLGGLPVALSIVAGMLIESEELKISELNELLADESTRLAEFEDIETGVNGLATTFELSYGSLPAQIQNQFASLGVFESHTFGSDAAAFVCGLPVAKAKMFLGRLTRLSLITYEDGSGRYAINPLLRVFAIEKAAENIEKFSERSAEFFLGKVKQNEGQEIGADWQNIVGSLDWFISKENWTSFFDGFLALTEFKNGSYGYLESSGHWQEGKTLSRQAAEHVDYVEDDLTKALVWEVYAAFSTLVNDQLPGVVDGVSYSEKIIDQVPESVERSRLKMRLALIKSQNFLQRDTTISVEILEEAISDAQKSAEDATHLQPELALLISKLGRFYGRQGRLDDAYLKAEESQNALNETESSIAIDNLLTMGNVESERANFLKAKQHLEKALELSEEKNDLVRISTISPTLGSIYRKLGRLFDAIAILTKSQSISRRIGNRLLESGSALNLGQAYLVMGEHLLAKNKFQEAQELAAQNGLLIVEALSISNLLDVLILTHSVTKEAGADLNQALKIAEQLQMNRLVGTLLRQKAQILSLFNNHKVAYKVTDQAMEKAEETDDLQEVGVIWRVRGEILCRIKAYKHAANAFQKAIKIFHGLEDYEWARTILSLSQNYPLPENGAQKMQVSAAKALATFNDLGAEYDAKLMQETINGWGLAS